MRAGPGIVEAWPGVALETSPTCSHVPELLRQQWAERTLDEGVRCDECAQTCTVKQRVSLEGICSAPIFGFPRAGHIGVDGVQRRNEDRVVCPETLDLGSKNFTLAAIVEHLSHAGEARAGHFVAWARNGDGWLRFDDTAVHWFEELPETVWRNIVLGVYSSEEHSSDFAQLPGEGWPAASVGCEDLDGRNVGPAEALATLPPARSTAGQSELLQEMVACVAAEELRTESLNQAAPSRLCLPRLDDEMEKPLQANLCSTFAASHVDRSAQFEMYVADFCRTLRDGGSVVGALRAVPAAIEGTGEIDWEVCLNDFKLGLLDVKQDAVECCNEIEVFLPLWRTMPLHMAVVWTSLSRVLSLPLIMLWDAFKVILSSLLHKDIAVEWQDYCLRQRYWAVIASDPGAGKSPALEFVMTTLRKAMSLDDLADCFPGNAAEEFHIVNDSTHAAFGARLNRADGYALLASPEAATTLCPKFPSSGEFNKSTHIDLERALEGATGGAIHWTTQADVLAKQRNARQAEQVVDKSVHHTSTNLSFVFFQQISMLQSWWAQGEARWKKGLTNRFLFSAGRRPVEVGAVRGAAQKIQEYLVLLLRTVAKHFGCGSRPARPFRLPPAAASSFLEARAIGTELAQDKTFADHGSLHSMLEKMPSWLTHEALSNAILRAADNCVLSGTPIPPDDALIQELECKSALQFVYLRLDAW